MHMPYFPGWPWVALSIVCGAPPPILIMHRRSARPTVALAPKSLAEAIAFSVEAEFLGDRTVDDHQHRHRVRGGLHPIGVEVRMRQTADG